MDLIIIIFLSKHYLSPLHTLGLEETVGLKLCTEKSSESVRFVPNVDELRPLENVEDEKSVPFVEPRIALFKLKRESFATGCPTKHDSW